MAVLDAYTESIVYCSPALRPPLSKDLIKVYLRLQQTRLFEWANIPSATHSQILFKPALKRELP
jgi:hypothetical protein